MPSQPPVPPLLSPILSVLPCTSLTLLTSTLGATTNWLVLRFICAALHNKGYGIGRDIHSVREDYQQQRVVLVSWLRDGAWWSESGRKLVSTCFVSVSTRLRRIVRRRLELIAFTASRGSISRKYTSLMA